MNNNRMRTFLCLLTAVLLAAFALPSVAASDKKLYSLEMQFLTSPPASPPYKVQATLTSVGNSTISSFKLTVSGLTIVSVDPPASGTVAGPFPGSSVSVTDIHVPKKSGQPFVLTLYVSSCGNGVWSAAVWTGAKLNGQSFTPNPNPLPASQVTTSIPCGELACGDGQDVEQPPIFVPDSLNPTGVQVERGFYDKNGDTPDDLCAPVSYTVTNFGSGLRHFEWPFTGSDSDPAAAFLYTVDSSVALTQVAWLESPPGTPVFIDGPLCLAPPTFPPGSLGILPAPYGALAAADTGGATILVDASGASVAHPGIGVNFDVVIGTDRLTVNYASGLPSSETWNVVARDVGNTSGALQGAGTLVMYTPLPLLPGVDPADGVTPLPAPVSPYAVNMQAQMCIVEQVTGSGGYTSFIDIGDGWHQP